MRDAESLCEEAGLGRVSASTASRICGSSATATAPSGSATWARSSSCLDAIDLPVRPSGAKEGVLCPWGIDKDGKRVLLDVCLGMRESEEDWLALGLNNAIEAVWPQADRQPCTVH
jgi:transposase-like protein